MTPLRRAAPWVAAIAAGAVASVALLGVISPVAGTVGPGTVELEARWDTQRRTDLAFPPLGQVSADTHRGPLRLTARVDRIDIDAVRRLAEQDQPDQVLAVGAQDDLRPLMMWFAIRAVVLAAAVGAGAAALLPRRRWKLVPLGSVGGVLAVGALLGTAAVSYDPLAFEEPRFEGPLSEAPRIIETVQANIDSFDQVQSRIDVLGAQLGDLYASAITEDLASTAGEVRILHVSDIHLNPLGLEVTSQLAEQFDVHAILDTGDFTTFGLPFESRLASLIEDMPAPYYLVPGNHDSPANRQGLRGFENLTVLDPGTAYVRGVEILGVGDPSFTASNELDDEEVDANIAAQQPEVERLVAEGEPDVLAVHDPHQADTVLEEVPLVLAGHLHEHIVRQSDGTVLEVSGSTGATGLGSFTVDTDLPYEASVLRFVDGDLRAIDAISLQGTGGEFRLERQVFESVTAAVGG